MNNLNSLIIEGNLTRDPEFREPTDSFKVCSFTVAVNRWYRNKKGDGEEEVSYFDVETYGKMAEICQKKLKRGGGVRVVGRLKQNRWEDNETGKQKSSIYVIAEHVEFKPVFNPSEKSNAHETEKTEKQTSVPVEKQTVSVEKEAIPVSSGGEVMF